MYILIVLFPFFCHICLLQPNALNLSSIASFTVIIYFCPRQQQVMIFCELYFEVAVMQSV